MKIIIIGGGWAGCSIQFKFMLINKTDYLHNFL